MEDHPGRGSKSMVKDLGFDVRKVIASNRDPVKACLDYFEFRDVDLIVSVGSLKRRSDAMAWKDGR